MDHFRGYHENGGDPHMWGWLFLLIVAALLIGLAVFLAVRYAGRQASFPAAAGTAAIDQPLAVLRMRYARGEVSRDEFLQASEDLGGPPGPVVQPPPPG